MISAITDTIHDNLGKAVHSHPVSQKSHLYWTGSMADFVFYWWIAVKQAKHFIIDARIILPVIKISIRSLPSQYAPTKNSLIQPYIFFHIRFQRLPQLSSILALLRYIYRWRWLPSPCTQAISAFAAGIFLFLPLPSQYFYIWNNWAWFYSPTDKPRLSAKVITRIL